MADELRQVWEIKLEDEAVKFDQDKPRMDLIPPQAILEVGKAMGFGSRKYNGWNYLNGSGLKHSQVMRAALTHLYQHQYGEDLDSESSLSHLSHAAASILMLLELTKVHPENDDRFEGYKKKVC